VDLLYAVSPGHVRDDHSSPSSIEMPLGRDW